MYFQFILEKLTKDDSNPLKSFAKLFIFTVNWLQVFLNFWLQFAFSIGPSISYSCVVDFSLVY